MTYEADSDGDGKTDLQELNGDYNSSATGIDGEPPEIWYYDCQYIITETELGLLKVPSGLEVWMIVGARDIFGIDNIEILISGLEDKLIHTNNDDNVTIVMEWTLTGVDEYKRAFLNGFNINVTATDRNGNIGFRNENLDSIKDIVVSAFLGPLLAYIEFLKELASNIFNWIYDAVTLVFDTLINMVDVVIQTIKSFLMQYIGDLGEIRNYDDFCEVMDPIFDFFNHPIMWVLFGLQLAVSIALMLINGVPLVAIVSIVISLIMTILIIIFMSEDENDGMFGYLSSLVQSTFDDNLHKQEEESKWIEASSEEVAGAVAIAFIMNLVGVIFGGISAYLAYKLKLIKLPPLVFSFFSALLLGISFSITLFEKDLFFREYLNGMLLWFAAVGLWVGSVEAFLTQQMDAKIRTISLIGICATLAGIIVDLFLIVVHPAKFRTWEPIDDKKKTNYDEGKVRINPQYHEIKCTIETYKTDYHIDQSDKRRSFAVPPDLFITGFQMSGNGHTSTINARGPYINIDDGELNPRSINVENNLYYVILPEEISIKFDTMDYDSRLDDNSLNPSNDPINTIDINGFSTYSMKFKYNPDSKTLVYNDGIREKEIQKSSTSNGVDYYTISGMNGDIRGTIVLSIETITHEGII